MLFLLCSDKALRKFGKLSDFWSFSGQWVLKNTHGVSFLLLVKCEKMLPLRDLAGQAAQFHDELVHEFRAVMLM